MTLGGTQVPFSQLFFSAIQSGSVLGVLMASFGVLVLLVLIELYKFTLALEKFVWRPWTCQGSSTAFQSTDAMFGVVAGYVWRCSSIALFCRVRVGISTETAAFGAALSVMEEKPTSWATLLATLLVWKLLSSVRLLRPRARC